MESTRQDDIDRDFEAFARIVCSRRSVRAFMSEPIPDAVIDACLDLALQAPNSHNLEPWQFIDVCDPKKRARLRHLCLNQAQALQAARLIVCIARPDFWRMGRQMMMDVITQYAEDPIVAPNMEQLRLKYRYLIPIYFEDGPLHVLAPLKRLMNGMIGLFRTHWRFDTGRSGQVLWATRTTALACQNLMLALRAAGYDSCPMEGFDEPRVKRLLKLPRAARVVMVIAAGKRAEGGVAPLVRFDRNLYVQRV